MCSSYLKRFHVAPFSCDGELLGIGEWTASNLESAWLDRLELLSAPDNSGQCFMPSPFSEYSVRATIVAESGIATFFVRNILAASIAMLPGRNQVAELQMLNLFIESVRKIPLVVESEIDSRMDQMTRIENRPLVVAIPWPDNRISDYEFDIISSSSIHFAAMTMSEQIK